MTPDPRWRWWRRLGSIRLRVTGLAAVAVLAVLSAGGAGLVALQRTVLVDSLDETVVVQADAAVDRVRRSGAAAAVQAVPEDVGVQVVGPDGDVVAATAGLRGVPALRPVRAGDDPVTVDGPDAGAPARQVSRTVEGLTVHVAGSLEDVEESTAALGAALTLVVPVGAGGLALVLWWSVGRSLRPVEAIRAQVERISASRLDSRVPEPHADDEIARLARTMNAMLARLETTSEQQRRFVADASHELRSPLARIRSELEVDAAHPDPARWPRTRAATLAQTLVLQRLVDDLLLLARSDAAAPALGRRALVDLDGAVHDVARERAGTDATGGGVPALSEPRLDLTGVRPAQVLGDEPQLRRAVANLVDNAVRHARSRVVVDVQIVDRTAVLTVCDDGAGIPAESAERVFERFTRLDDARGAGTGGAGLGLAIARDIARRHGGDLHVDPASARGARLVLTLPVAGTP